jgi:hypothetical protein
MSLFRKYLAGDVSGEDKEKRVRFYRRNNFLLTKCLHITLRKRGKFVYCEKYKKSNEQFLNILEENDWFECEAMTFEPALYPLLDENKLVYRNATNPKFLISTCESLVADEGSILFSSNQF